MSDSWRSIQGASKRLVASGPPSFPTQLKSSTRSKSLSHLLSDRDTTNAESHRGSGDDETRQEIEALSHERRFFGKAVRNLRKSWSRTGGMDGDNDDSSTRATDGYIRHNKGDDGETTVVFVSRKGTVMT